MRQPHDIGGAVSVAFITDQFSLQHLHYLRRNPHADFWLIERIGLDGRREPVGRLYLDRSEREWKAIDLCLLTKARGAGVGGVLIHAVQAAAVEAGADALTLYAKKTNHGARRLYTRIGFEAAPCPFPNPHPDVVGRPGRELVHVIQARR